MAYTARNTQTGKRTGTTYNVDLALTWAESMGWDDCETELMSWELDSDKMLYLVAAEFPCTYYGDYVCELTSNRPDSLCPFHAGEED